MIVIITIHKSFAYVKMSCTRVAHLTLQQFITKRITATTKNTIKKKTTSKQFLTIHSKIFYSKRNCREIGWRYCLEKQNTVSGQYNFLFAAEILMAGQIKTGKNRENRSKDEGQNQSKGRQVTLVNKQYCCC